MQHLTLTALPHRTVHPWHSHAELSTRGRTFSMSSLPRLPHSSLILHIHTKGSDPPVLLSLSSDLSISLPLFTFKTHRRMTSSGLKYSQVQHLPRGSKTRDLRYSKLLGPSMSSILEHTVTLSIHRHDFSIPKHTSGEQFCENHMFTC